MVGHRENFNRFRVILGGFGDGGGMKIQDFQRLRAWAVRLLLVSGPEGSTMDEDSTMCRGDLTGSSRRQPGKKGNQKGGSEWAWEKMDE